MAIRFHGSPSEKQRRFAEIVDGSAPQEEFGEMLSPDLFYEDWMAPGRRFEGLETFLKEFNGPAEHSFPDVRYPVDEAFACGEHLLLRGHFEATFTRDYFGFPAHGRPVRWEYRDLYRFNEEGRVDAIWFANDTLVVARELGADPIDERLWR